MDIYDSDLTSICNGSSGGECLFEKLPRECHRSMAKVNVGVCSCERTQWSLTGHARSLLTGRRAAAAPEALRDAAAAVMNSRL